MAAGEQQRRNAVLASGNSSPAALNLQGRYTSAFFSVANEGTGGTQINVRNPGTSLGTSADMIMSDQGGNYEIYNIGNNTIIRAYQLEVLTTVGPVAVMQVFGFLDEELLVHLGPGVRHIEIHAERDEGSAGVADGSGIDRVDRTAEGIAQAADIQGDRRDSLQHGFDLLSLIVGEEAEEQAIIDLMELVGKVERAAAKLRPDRRERDVDDQSQCQGPAR